MKKAIIAIIAVIILVPLIIFFGFPGVLYNFSTNKARKSAKLTKKSIKVGTHTVSYLDGGKGEVILCLHGLGGDKDNWSAMAKHVTPKFRVVALDLPGNGESSKNVTEMYTYTAQVERLSSIIKALKLSKFHIISHDMGGPIAVKYTIKNPAKVLSLALLGSQGVKAPQRSNHSKLLSKGKNTLAPNNVKEFDKLLKFLFIKPPSIPGPVKKYLLKKAIKARAFNTKIFFDVFGEDYFMNNDLGKIRQKTLVIWGDTDNITHISSVGILKKGLKNKKAVIMKDVGHLPMRQKPDETAKLYLDFLNK
ncbi:alpha/beta fold hydrolase [Spirochaetota bacterium]